MTQTHTERHGHTYTRKHRDRKVSHFDWKRWQDVLEWIACASRGVLSDEECPENATLLWTCEDVEVSDVPGEVMSECKCL